MRELSQETNIPIRFVNDLLYELMQVGLLTEVSGDEKSETAHYQPAVDLRRLSVGDMVDRLESYGQWKIDFDVSGHLNDKWLKVIEHRSNYLRQSRDVLLQDL